MLENAAIRVRYLLPLAAALLQQLPAAGPAAAGGQLISQATAQRLSQLSQQLEALKGVPLPPAGNQPQWVAGVGVTFELVLAQQHQASYQLYNGPAQQEASNSSSTAAATVVGAHTHAGKQHKAAAAGGRKARTAAALDEGLLSLLDLLPIR
jgi:hypothetical protein